MELQWSPNRPDHLVTWSQDISLYQVENCESGSGKLRQGCVRLSDSKAAAYLAKITEFPYSKVVDVYSGPESHSEGRLAVGLVNGKIILTSFGATEHNEIIPRHTRQVFSLQWGKSNHNLLAAGFEKARQDYGINVYDTTFVSKNVDGVTGNGNKGDFVKLAELGMNETAHSIAWVQPKSFLVGMNGKHIKLFDLRDSQPKIGSTASTKAVYGISVDNLCNHRVVSYAENQAFVWDMRNFEKPFVVLDHSKALAKVGWCPTRSGLLACLEKEVSYLTLHDVHHAALSAEDGEPAVLERRLSPSYSEDVYHSSFVSATLSSFAWHYSEENLVTTCTSAGVLWNSVVFERITLNWSSTSKLGWSNGKKTIQYIDNTDEVYSTLDDISVKMFQRAVNSYGLKTNLKDNATIVEDDEALQDLWIWLDHCKLLAEREKSQLASIGTVKYPGARVALRIDTATGSNSPPSALKSELSHNNFGSTFDMHNSKIYKSEERSFVQQLCGWNQGFLVDSQGSATRRAAIALFHLKIRQAIKILNESNNSIIAMAISGYTEDKNSLWRELAQTNCSQLSDPYIRAIFAFLTESDSNYGTILNEKELSVADRLGFACSFLPDSKLMTYVVELSNDLIKAGDLSGILLTGMTTQTFPLLQNYIDNTADIQTVAMLIIRTMAAEISNSSLLKLWTERYRELLDSWKLWEQRAEFDIMKNTNNPSLVPQSEVSISCNFCGKSISTSGLSTISRQAQLFSRFSSTNSKFKQSCCPSCRKPLPRCSICLMHMGTILGSSKEQKQAGSVVPVSTSTSSNPASSEAISWYTWCQTCKHGGHTVHLQHWFENQPECPVSGCSCKCNTLDRVVDFPTN